MINWYLNRLKTMTLSELPYRLGQVIRNKKEELFYVSQELIQKNIPETETILENQNFDAELIPNEFSIFGKMWNYETEVIDWHKDFISLKSFPITFSKKINIRKDPSLSAKNVWEANRLQFLPHIALNYNLTGEQKYLDQFIYLNTSWIEANPYLLGINWYSNIEINIRLINWFFCWEILKADELMAKSPKFESFVKEKWLPSIYQHCQYSYSNPSKYSSANNHLISEYAGLFIASSLWKFNESDNWLKYSRKGLEKEIVRQHSNGINKEEAAEYIQFIADFFLIAYLVADKTNNPFSKIYVKTLHEIFEYIYSFTDIKTNFPKYGDEDDGKVVCFSTDKHFNNFKSLLTSASIIFKDSRYKSKSSGYDLKNEIFFGKKGKEVFDKLDIEDENQKSTFYTKEGHFIFRKQQNQKEIYLHFDAASLGYLSIAAHSHADALSFILNINGIPVFVDPGTYSYHVGKMWRNYFVSTMAHNTICIDRKNQANHVGDTMWLDHYTCKILTAFQSDHIESVKATHDGYKNAKHIRQIDFDRIADTFIIRDEIKITNDKQHESMILFHLHPDIEITEITPTHLLLKHHRGIKLSLFIEGIEGLSMSKGSENPIFGWYSDSFSQKTPTTVVYYKNNSNISYQYISKIKIYEY